MSYVTATVETLDGTVSDLDLPVRASYTAAIDCAYAYFDNHDDVKQIVVVLNDADGNDRSTFTIC